MSEEALAEKEAAVAGEGLSPMASRAQMSTHSGFSGHSGPTSARSLAGAAHRVSISSASPVISKRDLDVDGHLEVPLVPLCIFASQRSAAFTTCCTVCALSTPFDAGMLHWDWYANNMRCLCCRYSCLSGMIDAHT